MRYFLPTKLPELMDLRDKRVLLIGLGTFGGGVGAAKFLANKGAKVSITDLRSKAELQNSIDEINNENVEYFLGNHDWIDIPSYDLVCVNPAVSPFHPMVLEAQQMGIPTTSEMNLFFAHCKGKIIGVTGSNGKSTTASLTAHLLQGSGRKVWFGGNIGHSLLPQVDQITEKDVVVLELSSFQLEDLHKLRKSPTVSILTNLTNNHLDRHKSFDAYFAAKMSAFCYQKSNNISIVNYDDPAAMQMLSYVSGRILTYSTSRVLKPGGFIQNGEFWVDLGKVARPVTSVNDITLPGKFNQSNALAAITAASVFKTPPENIARQLVTFKGLEHRLELVGEKSGIKFYNDSISTTPESTIAGISAFNKPIWLIVGGSNKGMNYGMMALRILNSPVVGVLGIGEIGESIVNLVQKINRTKNKRRNLITKYCETLDKCFDFLGEKAKPGHIVLMSPGTASYDQFKNFEARGDLFRNLVKLFSYQAYDSGSPMITRGTPDSRRIQQQVYSKSPSDESAELNRVIRNLSDDSQIYNEETLPAQEPAYQSFAEASQEIDSDFEGGEFSFESVDSFSMENDLFSDNDFADMLEQTINAAFDDEDSGQQDPFGGVFGAEQNEQGMMDFESEGYEDYQEMGDDQSRIDFPDAVDSKALFPDDPDMLDPIDTQNLTRDYLDKYTEDQRKKFEDSDFDQDDDDDMQEI